MCAYTDFHADPQLQSHLQAQIACVLPAGNLPGVPMHLRFNISEIRLLGKVSPRGPTSLEWHYSPRPRPWRPVCTDGTVASRLCLVKLQGRSASWAPGATTTLLQAFCLGCPPNSSPPTHSDSFLPWLSLIYFTLICKYHLELPVLPNRDMPWPHSRPSSCLLLYSPFFSPCWVGLTVPGTPHESVSLICW